MAEELRDLVQQYEQAVTDLNNSIDRATKANNEITIAKAEVTKNKHKMDLIKEQIMCEKKLIDASR